jgi:hypothetical protein
VTIAADDSGNPSCFHDQRNTFREVFIRTERRRKIIALRITPLRKGQSLWIPFGAT